jgi:hypothetical protein
MEASGNEKFMEEVSILTISMLFIVIYLYSIMCIYFDILLYDVFRLLHRYDRPSTSMDELVFFFTNDATIETFIIRRIPYTGMCHI